MILSRLDRLLCNVPTMVVGRDQLVSHVGGVDFGLVGRQDIVVENFIGGDDDLKSHPIQCLAAGDDHFALGSIFHWFDPRRATVYVIQNHLVVVTTAGLLVEKSCLVSEHDGPGLVKCDKDILSLFNWFYFVCQWIQSIGGASGRPL